MWVIGWLAKREKKKKMNEFVAYYKNFFVNFRNDPKKLKKKIKGEKRTKRRRIQLILTHTQSN